MFAIIRAPVRRGNIGGATVQPFRRYADALIAECRADAACDQSTIEWRGVTP